MPLIKRASNFQQAKARSRQFRRSSTDAESRLWYLLRSRQLDGFKFRRQYVAGPFIVDFVCLDAQLVVEVDGGQHYDEAQSQRDAVRTQYLEAHGFRVLRFSDRDVLLETASVLEVILAALPRPSP